MDASPLLDIATSAATAGALSIDVSAAADSPMASVAGLSVLTGDGAGDYSYDNSAEEDASMSTKEKNIRALVQSVKTMELEDTGGVVGAQVVEVTPVREGAERADEGLTDSLNRSPRSAPSPRIPAPPAPPPLPSSPRGAHIPGTSNIRRESSAVKPSTVPPSAPKPAGPAPKSKTTPKAVTRGGFFQRFTKQVVAEEAPVDDDGGAEKPLKWHYFLSVATHGERVMNVRRYSCQPDPVDMI